MRWFLGAIFLLAFLCWLSLWVADTRDGRPREHRVERVTWQR